ncbi:flavodoxin FldA [Magnetospirillum sp. 64-120]|uniref:flavodoxin FldA n=1 Tax=Magnetospirillum sp. 64-120 TaxID=1895778 RepID=UPI00092C493F|nr:flavodoxin FldA [Magnetospirillum sp. 64-120]OJX68628.1 MAG: flavodoxin [Magnetospirillum sp. 64-120]
MRVMVVYGSDQGCTRGIANRIAGKLNGKSLDIKKARSADLEAAQLLILGSPTYGCGDLQSDWEDRIAVLDKADLDGKTVALFGMGDQMTYPECFCDAVGILYDRLLAKGARVVGFTEPEGYDFSSSAALRDGRFVGLLLDEDNQSELTDERIEAWVGGLA